MPTEDTAIITTLRAFDTNDEKDQRSFRPKSQRDEVEKSIQTRFLDSAFGSARNDCEGVRKMNESNSKSEKAKDERRYDLELLKKGLRCDLDQYEMLKRCSDNNDMTEWNQWRKENPDKIIDFRGVDFSGWYLQGVDFGFDKPLENQSCIMKVFLSNANFDNANLRSANFQFSHVEEARFNEAHLENAKLMFAHFDNAFLMGVHLDDACLQCAELRGANICNSRLKKSNFIDSHLEGSKFNNACLVGAKFQMAHVSETTSFCYCEISRETDFREVGLESIRIDPSTKQLLEYNIRRKNWEDWYKYKDWQSECKNKRHVIIRVLMWFIKLFWSLSDYGRSTLRIIGWFFGLAFLFAFVYYSWGCIDYYRLSNKDYPGIVSNLFVLEDSKQAVSGWLVPLRAFYFSIVTMTTLGLGDMYANAHSLFRGIFGHILLAFQVTLGYVLLGALVTRFAVLFTAGGPAGKFADDQHAKNVA